jgi:hypothetical protein
MISRTLTILTLLLLGCGEDGTTSAPADAGIDSGTDTDTASGTDFDCAALPQGPFDLIPDVGVASRDVAFDDEGNLVGSDYYDIYKTSIDGEKDKIVDGIASCTGIRYLPNGSLVYAEEVHGRLVLFDVDGQHEVMSDLFSPRGIAVDLEGLVYVADPPMNSIKRVDPYTFESEVVIDTIYHPAVMAFDVNYERLFIATTGTVDNDVFVAAIGEDGGVGEVEVFAEDVGKGWHVGIAVDACGNLYLVEHQCDGELSRSCVHRVSAEGVVEKEPLAVLDDEDAYYVAGIEWGSGIGGWIDTSLYLGEQVKDSVYRLDVGVPSKPKVFP